MNPEDLSKIADIVPEKSRNALLRLHYEVLDMLLMVTYIGNSDH